MQFDQMVNSYIQRTDGLYSGSNGMRLELTVRIQFDGSFEQAAAILQQFYDLATEVQRANAKSPHSDEI